MKELSITTLATMIGAELQTAPNTKCETQMVTGISIDSRTIKSGDCFFAIEGENSDGHNYVAQAFKKGAVCTVVGKNIDGTRILKVNDTIKALGNLARQYRRGGNFKVVAITGSVGKTTARHIAYHVLRQHYDVCTAPKNYNNEIGLPLTMLGVKPEDEIVIAELGANHPGEIAYLAKIAAPDIAVITNVQPAHLEGFGNLETIVEEKLSIAEGLQRDGVLIINGDCEILLAACKARQDKFITFGKSNNCDIQAKNIAAKGSCSELTVEDTQIILPLPGYGNIENALAAWAICHQFGVSIKDFAAAVKTLNPVPMRTELLQIGTLTVLNDCYNANPASMKNALEILANLEPAHKRRRVFICGDMAELGSRTETLHGQLAYDVIKSKMDLLLSVGKSAKITAETAKKISPYKLQTKSFKDSLEAGNNVAEFIKDYDIILLKGSRSAKLELAIEKLKELYD